MNCWHCNEEVLWVSEQDAQAYGWEGTYAVVTKLHCPLCGSDYDVCFPKQQQDKTDETKIYG